MHDVVLPLGLPGTFYRRRVIDVRRVRRNQVDACRLTFDRTRGARLTPFQLFRVADQDPEMIKTHLINTIRQ